jgi:hypothetical protein
MWNTLHVNVSLDDLLARPFVGGGGFTRESAHAEVQKVLDGDPALSRAAEQWRMDVQRVRVGPKVWTLYEYDDDSRAAALARVDELLKSFREAGVRFRVANLPS